MLGDQTWRRRIQLDRLTPLEIAAIELIRACEAAGAHPALTDAQRLAIQAKEAIANWIDAGADGASGGWVRQEGANWMPQLWDDGFPRPWINPPIAVLEFVEQSPEGGVVITRRPIAELPAWARVELEKGFGLDYSVGKPELADIATATAAEIATSTTAAGTTSELVNFGSINIDAISDHDLIEEAPAPAPALKAWRILTFDGSWFDVEGRELRRDDDWIEIIGAGKWNAFHRPQAVEQIR